MGTQQWPSLEEREGMESAPGVEVPTSGGENSDPHTWVYGRCWLSPDAQYYL